MKQDAWNFRTAFASASVALAMVIANAYGDEMRTIGGQLFIRTKGGDNIKLSLVDVALFDEKAIAQVLEEKRKIAAPIYKYWQSLSEQAEKDRENNSEAWLEKQGKADYAHSALYYFSNLPQPLQTSRTDADGRFAFRVPVGSYVLVAASNRTVGEITESMNVGVPFSIPIIERYYWMVKLAAIENKNVDLTNANLSSSGSADSLILTLENEDNVNEVMGDKGIDFLITPDQSKRREQVASDAAAQERQQEARLRLFRKNPQAAQRAALALYPELGVSGSPLNKEFVARLKRYQAEKKDFFVEPDWPIRLAKECREDFLPKQSTQK